MTQDELDTAKRRAFTRRRGERVAGLIGPDGKRWKFVASRGYWAQVTFPDKPSSPMFRNSKTMCRNRNDRRKSFGYTDAYSMRERGWPYRLHKGKPY